jgi:NADPH:quinone reductase-like Zn-dependent oxidoreductase
LLLKEHGIDHVFIDTGSVAERVRKECPGGVEKVLELVGTTTLADSLRCARRHGAVCMSGMVGDRWTLDGFEPMEAIPMAVSLTTYSGGATEFMATPLQRLVEQVENGTLPMKGSFTQRYVKRHGPAQKALKSAVYVGFRSPI